MRSWGEHQRYMLVWREILMIWSKFILRWGISIKCGVRVPKDEPWPWWSNVAVSPVVGIWISVSAGLDPTTTSTTSNAPLPPRQRPQRKRRVCHRSPHLVMPGHDASRYPNVDSQRNGSESVTTGYMERKKKKGWHSRMDSWERRGLIPVRLVGLEGIARRWGLKRSKEKG